MTQPAAETRSKDDKKNLKSSQPPAAETPAPETAPVAAAPLKGNERFQEVELDRPTFKAELFLSKKPGSLIEIYEGPICQGHVVGHVEMPEMLDTETGELRAWFCYVIELTAPTTGVDRGQPKELGVGDQVLVAETAKLKQAIPIKVANHPTLMVEVQIKPISRAPMADDPTKRMWNTKVAVAQPVSRRKALSGNSIIAGMLSSASSPQLNG